MDNLGWCSCSKGNVSDIAECVSNKECDNLCNGTLSLPIGTTLTSNGTDTVSLSTTDNDLIYYSEGTNKSWSYNPSCSEKLKFTDGNGTVSIPKSPDTSKKPKTATNEIQLDYSPGLSSDAYITYSDESLITKSLSLDVLHATKSLSIDALHVNGESKIIFDKKGKIENVESIQWSSGSVLKLPTMSVANSGQVLVYLNGNLVWQDVNTIIKKENSMLNVKAVWTFTDYLSIFLIALFAIWLVKHVSWKVVLTPIKKLFKFGEKKVKEAEEELKKAEEVWKEIE